MISFFNAIRSEKRIQYLVRRKRLESRYGTQPRAHNQQKEAQSVLNSGREAPLGGTGIWESFLCATQHLEQNKAPLSSTQKCGCLCHFNWSVFVKWGLYLLIAWGLCLPSLVEPSDWAPASSPAVSWGTFLFSICACLIRELLWSKHRRVQGLQGGITPNYSNNC